MHIKISAHPERIYVYIYKDHNVNFFFTGFGYPIPSNAEDNIEDLIYIAESASKITAIISGVKSSALRLKPNEKVLWSDSSGYLGAVLTDQGFYVISVSSSTWKRILLSSNETETAIASLSPFIALLATDDRAIGYNIASNSFYETRLPLRDTRIAVASGENVAVLVMSSKIFGIKTKSSSFTEARLKTGEIVEDVNVTENKVTVRTSDRLLTFVSTGSMWNVTRLN